MTEDNFIFRIFFLGPHIDSKTNINSFEINYLLVFICLITVIFVGLHICISSNNYDCCRLSRPERHLD